VFWALGEKRNSGAEKEGVVCGFGFSFVKSYLHVLGCSFFWYGGKEWK
jgi:hypothetical protein